MISPYLHIIKYISFESFSQSAKHIYQQVSRRVIIVESTNFVTIKNSNILSVNDKKKTCKNTDRIRNVSERKQCDSMLRLHRIFLVAFQRSHAKTGIRGISSRGLCQFCQ